MTEPVFAKGDIVQKHTGDYHLPGVVRGTFETLAGKTLINVEHEGGFVHVYSPSNLRRIEKLPPTRAELECQLTDAQGEIEHLRWQIAEWRKTNNSLARQRATAVAALEHIIRECGALNKGPIAVEIARNALAQYASRQYGG